MNDILDQIETNSQIDEKRQSFKFIALGMVLGIGVLNLFGSLKLILQSILFQLNIFGFPNKIVINLVALITMLLSVKLLVQYFYVKFRKFQIDFKKLFTSSIIILFTSFIIQILIPFSAMLDKHHYENMDQNLTELGRFLMVSSIMDAVGYFAFIFIAAWIIINVENKYSR